MKKMILLSVFWLAISTSFSQYRYVIHGVIDNSVTPNGKSNLHNGDSLELDFINIDRKVVAYLKGDSFRIEGEVPYPSVAMLDYKYGGDLFLLDNSSYQYKLTLDKLDSIHYRYSSSITTGSAFYNLWHGLSLLKGELYSQKDSIQQIIAHLSPDKKDSLLIQNTHLHEIDDKIIKVFRDFADQHPNTYYTAYLVVKAPDFSYANYIDVYNGFSDSIKNSFYGRNFKERLIASKTLPPAQISLGADSNHFPTVAVVDPSLKKVMLDNAFFKRNKYTLIEFWASWCGPCRRVNRDMNSLVGTLRAKHLELVGYSLDNVSLPWKIAIKSDALKWLQVSDLQGANSPLAGYLGIEAIPYNVIVDSEGTIVRRNVYGKDLDEFLKSLN